MAPSNYVPVNPLEELHYALEVMQNFYFQLWLGTWPTCIDWTGAVLGTFVSASLFSLTRSLDYSLPKPPQSIPNQPDRITMKGERIENEIDKYFSQSIAYYFGEDYFGIRMQAYDDMLWVVLGWLESVRFVKLHTLAHYPAAEGKEKGEWYGRQFVPAFAHRAHVFYDIAKKGWDTELCGGGMNWNPRLTPYKNAITNELYISASIGMYLYFPGDLNSSPFATQEKRKCGSREGIDAAGEESTTGHSFDPVYRKNAIEAYTWLKHSNMTNEKGLYVDGFHIKGWRNRHDTGTGNCDERNEMVYTYNQGVLLSGLRGLWEGTGERKYLEDGHALVRNVIAATGWKSPTERTSSWQGLGSNGIMEEICDKKGTCSQNAQTFKGIYFHHLTLFCEPLPRIAAVPGKTFSAGPEEVRLHSQSCNEYATWVTWNARAALSTRDRQGRFGMWWGANVNVLETATFPVQGQDYRNRGLGDAKRWGTGWYNDPDFPQYFNATDANDRGRGRTVETQGGGVAVVRAMWEFVGRFADVVIK
ncbi:Six-hairpin glycosidase [Tothia fuscella]|uniref:Six-hairpin glycosidase n=1 Tax=Tothia fuscella TaxID=1048955 RepID=A0A9P4NFI3_9PEZI|nr:Six-hairpin glycosidase [Tothia fuscella]